MTTNRSTLSRQIITNDYGEPEPGARAFFYIAGTTTPLTVYQDGGGSVAHTHPVLASAGARMPAIYVPYGSHKIRITSASNVLLWEDDNVPNPAPTTITGGAIDPVLTYRTGYILPYLGAILDGFIPLNGLTIGNASSGATGRQNDDAEDLFTHLWQSTANDECAVTPSGRGASAAADWAAGKQLALPNWQGRAPYGRFGMGAAPLAVAAGASVPSGKSDNSGALIGSQTQTISIAQMPNHGHGATTGPTTTFDVAPVFTNLLLSTANPQYVQSVATGTTVTGSDHAHPISLEGGGEGHNNIGPGVLVSWMIKL